MSTRQVESGSGFFGFSGCISPRQVYIARGFGFSSSSAGGTLMLGFSNLNSGVVLGMIGVRLRRRLPNQRTTSRTNCVPFSCPVSVLLLLIIVLATAGTLHAQ